MQTKRDDILEMVLRFLSQEGVQDKLTISNLAQQLDMGKSTIYEYFKNKNELIKGAVLLLMKQSLEALIDEEAIQELSFEPLLKKHLENLKYVATKKQMANEFLTHPDVVGLTKEDKFEIMATMKQNFEHSRHYLDQILEKGIEENILSGKLTKERRQAIEALIFGGMIVMSNPFNYWDLERFTAELYESIVVLHQ